MSTVALKGKLELIETKETIRLSAESESHRYEKASGANTATSKGKSATITRKVRKWHWKGKWAFGSHIDETFANKIITTPLPKKAHKLQPFHYCFEEIADPVNVAVPSLALLSSLPTDPTAASEDTIAGKKDESSAGIKSHSALNIEELQDNCFELNGALSVSPSSRDDGVKTRNPHKADPTIGDVSAALAGVRTTLDETDSKTLRSGSSPSLKAEKRKDNPRKSTNAPDSMMNETGMVPKSLAPSMEAAISPQRLSQFPSQNHITEPKFEKAMIPGVNEKSKNQRKELSRHDNLEQIHSEKRRIVDENNLDAQVDADALNGCGRGTKINEAVEAKPQVTDSAYSATPKQLDPSLSFAAVSSGEPPFTEALSFFRHKNCNNLDHENTTILIKSTADDDQNPCPSSGLWKGYFQNATVGRGKGTQRIQEQFYLFLNACPGKNAVFSFDGVQHQMPPTHVQDPILVRGSGENQFGIFEICGYFNIATMEMEIQRQYVHVEEETPMTKPSPNKKKRQRLTTPVVTRHKSTRPSVTRKRQPSWKVKSQEHDDEDEPYKRKKRKMNVETSYSKAEVYSSGGTTPSSIAAAGSVGSGPDSIILSTGSPSNVGTTKTPIKRKSSNPAGSVRRRGPAAGTFKASPKHTHVAAVSNSMKLPPTGDAQKAKWRAAHFLYYQRHDPEEQQSQQQQQVSKQTKPQNSKQQQSPSGTSSTSTSTNPKYVIYEGEMVDAKREGRGICLYSNNMLYEGEWKRNKEHGYGKVMTSDRARIIYEGEFERGRMQGIGTYFYEQAENSKCTDGGARYIGEFKENMRNGIGKYYLPDKSVYDGMWSNGLMNGRGVFTWADNSFYDGEWKDGKRTGQGILKTSEGFYYDGMWVNNAMEGRGFAVYPSGQKYEGLFSKGRREGRGTLTLTNGVVYEGRFRDDAVDGQGTMKMSRATLVPRKEGKDNFMIPISFQSDMSHIHTKAGFTSVGD